MTSGTPTQHNRIMVLLSKLNAVEERLDDLAADVDDLANKQLLDDDDLVNLLWARKHDRTKTGTQEVIDALRTIGQRDTREVLVRVVASYGNMSMSDAEDFVDDLYDLRDKYAPPSGGSNP